MATTESIRTEYAHVVRTPGTCGGEPRIDGHRIRVRDLAAARDRAGAAPEEIAGTIYPALTLAQVYAGLAYYEDHRQEIDAFDEAERQAVQRFQADHPSLIGKTDPVPRTE